MFEVRSRSQRIAVSACALLVAAGGGAVASATHPALAASALSAIASSVGCSTTAACVSGSNTGSGAGVAGTGTKGIGVSGTSTSTYAVEGISKNGRGVQGVSTTSNGVGGQTTSGTAGVSGQNASSTGYGVYGKNTSTSTSGTQAGVFGVSTGQSPKAVGVQGQSPSIGMLAEANATPTESVYGLSGIPIALYAVAKEDGSGYAQSAGIEVEGDSFVLEAQKPSLNEFVELLNPGYLLAASNGGNQMVVDESGNETLSGSLTTGSGTYIRQRGASGATALAYEARATAPQLEDTGEATLSGGRAIVPIDGALGDVIDRHTPYSVFLTPEGDCRGLYVSQKTAESFTVRELQGGRSSLVFDYRIVARPLGDAGRRLPIAPAVKRFAATAGSSTTRRLR